MKYLKNAVVGVALAHLATVIAILGYEYAAMTADKWRKK
jgi:energy-converting hydrogenase Eha subunit C